MRGVKEMNSVRRVGPGKELNLFLCRLRLAVILSLDITRMY